jgi:exopolyphosphatase/guanosine-5'-triphosphate,3'-diphosphate pyrophosphatase
VDIGCVRLTERHLRNDPPTAEQIAAAEADVDAAIARAGQDVPLERATAVVGVAGSITTITAHAMKLPEYSPDVIHGTELPIDTVRAASTDLLEMVRSERAALPYMHPGRVDVIGAGGLVWRRILERMGGLSGGRITTATASEHDILDGIALSIG